VASARNAERTKIAARLLRDLFCYHRGSPRPGSDHQRPDSINLISDDKVRELSSLNGMLYEFLPRKISESSRNAFFIT